MAEAATQFQMGLDQLALLPNTPERQRQELEFCSALGTVLLAVKGVAAPKVGHAYARVRGPWITRFWASAAEQLVSVATEQGFPQWRAQATIYCGLVKVKNGDVAEGISLLRSATGAEAWTPHYTALLASACEIAGQIEEGLILLDEALQIVERTGERWLEAELNRHKGQLRLRQGHTEAAE
jgi:hypothetical protein